MRGLNPENYFLPLEIKTIFFIRTFYMALHTYDSTTSSLTYLANINS